MKKVLSFAIALFMTAGVASAQSSAEQDFLGDGQAQPSLSTNGADEQHLLTYNVSEYVWIDLVDESDMHFDVDPLERVDPNNPGTSNYGPIGDRKTRQVKYSTNSVDAVTVELNWDVTGDFPTGNATFMADVSQSAQVAQDGPGGSASCDADTPCSLGSVMAGPFNVDDGTNNRHDILTGAKRSGGTLLVGLQFYGDQFTPAQEEDDAEISYVIKK